MDPELLINLIQERPVLWDKREKKYHNRLLTHREWEKVGEIMETTGDAVKKKWKHLRDTFCRELKKIPIPRSGADGDSEPKYKGAWPYFECMSFLRVIMKPRKTTGNIEETDDLEDLSNENTNDTILSESATMDDESQNTCERIIFEQIISDSEPWMPTPEDSSSTAETTCMEDNNTLQPGTMISTTGLQTQDCIILQQTPVRPKPPKRAATIKENRFSKKKKVDDEFHEAFLEMEREKMNIFRKEQLEDNDDDICWFKSLLPYLKQLPALNKLQFRTKMQEILIEELEKKNSTVPSKVTPTDNT